MPHTIHPPHIQHTDTYNIYQHIHTPTPTHPHLPTPIIYTIHRNNMTNIIHTLYVQHRDIYNIYRHTHTHQHTSHITTHITYTTHQPHITYTTHINTHRKHADYIYTPTHIHTSKHSRRKHTTFTHTHTPLQGVPEQSLAYHSSLGPWTFLMLVGMESGCRKHGRWQMHCNFLRLVCPAPHRPGVLVHGSPPP